jgi:alpha-galactosidase
MDLKIAVLGAGSAVFSVSVVKDLCLTRRLEGASVSLMDPDRDRLDAVHALCARYAAETGARLRIERTTSRRRALAGADFVVTTALAGRHAWLHAGWRIARARGWRFGGSLHVMHDEAFWINAHQLALMDSIQRDIHRLAPKAWHLLLANPVFAGTTWLTRRYPGIRLVGLCHGWGGVYDVARVAGIPSSRLGFEVAGVNHFLWLTKLEDRGRDALPRLDRWVRTKADAYGRRCGFSDLVGPKPVDVYRKLGAFPIGDTCNPGGGSWPAWHHASRAVERRWREDPASWYRAHFRNTAAGMRWLIGIARDPARRVTEAIPPHPSGESTVPIIESIAFDRPRRFIVNVPNTGGIVPGLPETLAIEAPAIVSGRGVRPLRTSPLPAPVLAWTLRDRVAPVEAELLAYARGSRDLLVQLVCMDPWTKTRGQAERLVDAILAQPWNGFMRRHYR